MSRWWGASGHQGRKMEGGMASSSSPIPIPSLSPPSSHRRSPPLTPRLLAHACRRKVMKAISLKGVLRTEINPSLDKVTVVGDVDSRVLVKKLSKVGKIAEVMAPPPPPSPAAPSEEGKKSDSNGSEKPTSPADEKSTRKDEGKDGKGDKSPAAAAAAACKQECSKCTAGKEAATRADEAGRAAGKTASSKDATTKSSGDGDKSEPAAVVVEYQYHHHYNRLEPAMVVLVHLPYFAANATPYHAGGYYPMPPPMSVLRHPSQLRPQPSRFDEDYFNKDNTAAGSRPSLAPVRRWPSSHCCRSPKVD
uniref:HMA domain-containing protein n=1 Tax=Oryza glumipatula TaxID=40148 RepID=A0A0D9YZW1_9ORYZ